MAGRGGGLAAVKPGASIEELKALAGRRGAGLVRDGMVVGLGTGSTARHAILALGERVREGLRIVGVPTSLESERLARECGIPLTTLDEHPEIDVTIDGADEVDPRLNLVKGLGGALLREKLVALATRREVIVVDGSKLVERLGTRAPVPVEVVRFGHTLTARRLAALGCAPALRMAGGGSAAGGPYVTDNGNLIYDCRFAGIPDPARLERELRAVPGVVESGIFVGLAHLVIVASAEGVREIRRPEE
ncbi:MAG: ribose-5-phosphate isomerase RpiA [Thermoplasmata archaeon]